MIRFAENLNKMIDAGLGGALQAPRTEVAVGHRIQYMDASGPVASFETNVVAPLKKLIVNMLPVQAGSGDPSPDNIRPISGRDSVTVTRTGKNLFDASVLTEQSSWKTVMLPLPPGTYTMSTSKPANDIPVYFRLSSDSTLGSTTVVNNAHPVTQTIRDGDTAEVVFRRMSGDDSFSNYHYQIELGSTATDYEPYDGQSATIALGQTVYGGTVDAAAGVMTVEWANIASYNGETLPGLWISDRDVYAPGATPTIGAQVCYELAEPQSIQLTPAELSTLVGDNTIWSDAGDVDVTYQYYEETEGY